MQHATTTSSLREKIGQMLLVGFRGASPEECGLAVRDIREHHVGGVILFDQDVADPSRGRRNIHSPEQVRKLLAFLQSQARVPLLTAVDQEGGRVDRKSTRLNSSHVSESRMPSSA